MEWTRAFNCLIYTSVEDEKWLEPDLRSNPNHRFLKSATQAILPDVTAVRVGGHFDGSLVLHWDDRLFIADTFVTVPVSDPPYPQGPFHNRSSRGSDKSNFSRPIRLTRDLLARLPIHLCGPSRI